jgi:hypothetical protein
MSDRLYVRACTPSQAPLVAELLEAPCSLPGPRIVDGVLYAEEVMEPNPRWRELMGWLNSLDAACLGHPYGSLARLYWRWCGWDELRERARTGMLDQPPLGGAMTGTRGPDSARLLLWMYVGRAQRLGECYRSALEDVKALLSEHADDDFFLEVGEDSAPVAVAGRQPPRQPQPG